MGARTWGLAAVALIALAGCGDDDDTDAATTTTKATTTPTADPGTSAEEAASIVAGYRGRLETALQGHRDCDSIDCMRAVAGIERLRGMAELAAEMSTELREAAPFVDPIFDLGRDSYNAARGIATDWDQQVVPCVNENRDDVMTGCGEDFSDLERQITELVEAILPRWDPYL